jgi:hypothetical protein
MSERLATEIYCGRPYGGVGFLWRKTLSGFNAQHRSASGRVMSVSLCLDNNKTVNCVSVYFPCVSSSCQYKVELCECLSDIEQVLLEGCDTIILGDTNFVCDVRNEGYKQCYSVLSRYNVFHCDDFIGNDCDRVTYRSDALGQSSFIDHMFISDSLRHCIVTGHIDDSGANLSDHLPLIYTCNLSWSSQKTKPSTVKTQHNKMYSWRWDKADLSRYYQDSDLSLRKVVMPTECLHCKIGCTDKAIKLMRDT